MQSPSTLISYLLNLGMDGILTIQIDLESAGIDMSKYDQCEFFNINHPDFHVYRVFSAIVGSNHFFSESGVTVTTSIASLDIVIKGPDELDFMDTIKLIDMLITDSLPSQVIAYYREVGEVSSKSALKARKIVFSDGLSSIDLASGGAGWILSPECSHLLGGEIDSTLRKLNGSFFSARHAEFFQGASFAPVL